jgi:ubiquinone/menaquinone biosynthesis C-methylase UbiE
MNNTNTIWSDFIQSSEELYRSRSLRFRADNTAAWLPFLHINEGAAILEIGCAGGSLLHRVKQLIPSVTAIGLDRDSGHIEYAKRKTIELNLNCDFYIGDALALPFENNTFDVTFSNTVTGHVPIEPFLEEQLRVLKPGGRVVVLSVRTKLNLNAENWKPIEPDEQALFDKLWGAVDKSLDSEIGVAAYELDEREYPAVLETAGFINVDVEFFTVMDYSPDNHNTSDELAIEQIETNRVHAIESVNKAMRRAPEALTEDEKTELFRKINDRYDTRITQYQNNEKIWDMTTSTVLCATGCKPDLK